MENNFQSLSYFLPELVIIFTVLFVIISDLNPSVKKYSFYISLIGIFLSGTMLSMINSIFLNKKKMYIAYMEKN